MNQIELKEAALARAPVVYDGIEYSRVKSIAFTVEGDHFRLQAALIDENSNSVTICDAGKVERKR